MIGPEVVCQSKRREGDMKKLHWGCSDSIDSSDRSYSSDRSDSSDSSYSSDSKDSSESSDSSDIIK